MKSILDHQSPNEKELERILNNLRASMGAKDYEDPLSELVSFLEDNAYIKG